MQAIDNNLIALAQHMADKAGDILRRAFRKPISVESKADASPVTLADREVEAAIRKLIEEYFPEHGIIGEEYGNVREDAEYQWVLDPIDGTRSFIGGYPIFTTLIGLAHKGTPILGIIDQPITKERWVGVKGNLSSSGLTRGSIDKKELSQATIATTSIDYFTESQLKIFQNLRKQCANCILGGDAYAYAMLASGHIDIVVDAGLKPYDFCAIAPVIENAGGIITDWDGKPITIKSDGRVIAAASKELHQSALKIL